MRHIGYMRKCSIRRTMAHRKISTAPGSFDRHLTSPETQNQSLMWARSFATEEDAVKMRAIEKLYVVLRMQLGQIA